MLKSRMLTPVQMERMRDHRYNVQGRTLLDPIMQVLWCRLADMVPHSLNSNLITVAGLALNLTSSVILMYYSPTATEEVPRWACALTASTMFLYQICDALDGKQCVRWLAKRDWHLAEVFDHASDSISIVFVSIELAICMQIGNRPDLYLTFVLSTIFMFFTAHWQTYISGFVRFGMFDVTESELSLCFGYLLTAILGQQFWTKKFLGVEWREMAVFATALMGVVKFVNHALFLWRQGNKLTVAGTSVVSPLLHITTVFILAIVTKETTSLYDCQPSVFFVVFGLIGAKMSNKLMIAYMTKSEMVLPDTILFGPVVLLANQLLGCPLQGCFLLWAVGVYTAIDLLRYFKIVSHQICELLQLTCFGPYQIEELPNGSIDGGSGGINIGSVVTVGAAVGNTTVAARVAVLNKFKS